MDGERHGAARQTQAAWSRAEASRPAEEDALQMVWTPWAPMPPVRLAKAYLHSTSTTISQHLHSTQYTVRT